MCQDHGSFQMLESLGSLGLSTCTTCSLQRTAMRLADVVLECFSFWMKCSQWPRLLRRTIVSCDFC